MNAHFYPSTTSSLLIVVRSEPPGQFTAQAVGLPEIQTTAATREEAIEQVQAALREWLAEGRLVLVPVSPPSPSSSGFGPKDPNDPLEQEFLQDLARFRQEDLERTLREYEQEDRECSNTSSTPTT
jgi:predicted RNase H-like HicB family nuclease